MGHLPTDRLFEACENDAEGVFQESDLQDLVRVLKDVSGIIGIDGFQGSGKSTLAERLRMELERPAIHVDDVVTRNSEGYVEFVRIEEFRGVAQASPPD